MMRSTWMFVVFWPLLTGSSIADDWIGLEAEDFRRDGVECRTFGGVVGVVFPNDKSSIATTVQLPGDATAELWARVYFPWEGQEALSLKLDQQQYTVSARTTTGGGRWDMGDFQVWHWVRAARTRLKAGKHELSVAPAASSGQRVDRIVLYWGDEPAWSCSWFGDGAALPNPVPEWAPSESLRMDAVDCTELQADVETLGEHKVAVLRQKTDRLVAAFRSKTATRATVWARVYFEAKNMYEGLTMQEMASNLYVSVDGELRKTVYQQNARQWHWIALDEPCEFSAGLHRVALYKHGLPVKVDCIVVYAGDDAVDQPWFRSAAPPSLPFSMASEPEVGRVGHWRVHGVASPGEMELTGESGGPAKWPVRIELPTAAAAVDLQRVAGLVENPTHGDRTPHQQVSVWVKSSGGPLTVSLLYTDRNGEAFLQRLCDQTSWSGWRLLSANIPTRLELGEAGFDRTGYATRAVVTPEVDAAPVPASPAGTSYAGGDRNASADFPLEVRALRFVKPAGKGEIAVGEPFFESPITLRAKLTRQTEDEAAFHVEVRNQSASEKTVVLEYRIGNRLADLTDEAMRSAMFQRCDVNVRPRATANVPVTLHAPHPGIYYLECRVGQSAPLRRYVAFGKVWEDKLADFLRGLERVAAPCGFPATVKTDR